MSQAVGNNQSGIQGITRSRRYISESHQHRCMRNCFNLEVTILREGEMGTRDTCLISLYCLRVGRKKKEAAKWRTVVRGFRVAQESRAL